MTLDTSIEVRSLYKRFPIKRSLGQAVRRAQRRYIEAVNDVSFRLAPGESLGLAGESGSGKTVTAEIIAKLQAPSSGQVLYGGRDIAEFSREEEREYRKNLSMVLQDPFDTLNPRWTIGRALLEPLRIHHQGDAKERRQRIERALKRVALEPASAYIDRYPHELSGGERQRVAVARALVLEPKVLVADEPTTMLDVSIRAGLLNLLRDIQAETGLSLLFISHDFATLAYLCERIAIMYRGRIVESGPTREVLTHRRHPYTRAMASAIPVVDPHRRRTKERWTTEEMNDSDADEMDWSSLPGAPT